MITIYQANRDLSNAFGRASNTYPETLYLGLSTALASDGETAVINGEVTGNGYARASFPNTSGNFTVAANKSIKNNTAISFDESTDTWGTVKSLGIFDAATGGNMLYYQNLTTERTVPSNTIVRFQSESITVSLT